MAENSKTSNANPRLSWGWKLLALMLVVVVGYEIFRVIRKRRQVGGDREMIRTLVDAEELMLELTSPLKELAKSVLNLQVPDHQSYPLLEERIEATDLEPSAQPKVTAELATVGVTISRWPVAAKPQKIPLKKLQMWRRLLETVDYFEHAKFYFIRGQFSDTVPTVFQTEVGFAGLAFTKDAEWQAVKAKQKVDWRPESADAKPNWRICAWHLESLNVTDSDRPLFDEVLDDVLTDGADLRTARRSNHSSYVISQATTGSVPLANEKHRRYFDQTATGQHPGLAVVDVDNDGWDDLYVMVRWGRNQLLHNQGDGTFIERAQQLGLGIDGISTSGIFADFDNDGDQDLMLGRSLERSMYLVNDGGRYVDRSRQLVSVPLPFLVTSVSATDYNGDGLLDVYLSTYGRPGGSKSAAQWAPEFLPANQVHELLRRYKDPDVGYNPFVNRIGPPNLLLVNRGEGRFEVAPENEQLALWLNSFQATWADFDEDGDPDLYVSNDFAPDYLFRNDGARGFVDITNEAGGETMSGFGMGASWGDYDNDGRQDLYISNMYSKAGMRITAQIRDLDPRFRLSADGNRLYRCRGDRFQLVSGRQSPALLVTQAGWSWGGQFMDVDNDGYLDIYVTSGYDTIPEKAATDVDL